MGINHAYEKEKAESWRDALEQWIMDAFEEFCSERASLINDRPYTYTCYSGKDVKKIIKAALR